MSLILLILVLYSEFSLASPPGDKRTILTSGEKVHTIKYQLGQSTILYFGIRPETVICGNKNYFNIEKLKDGITVQPLGSFSTNLTIMAQGRRFLFYLTPAGGSKPDGFIEVKWIPPNQIRSLKPLASSGNAVIKDISQKIKLTTQIELLMINEKSTTADKRRIFEFELRNLANQSFSTKAIEIVASRNGLPLERQVLAWETEEIKKKSSSKGRVIVTDGGKKPLSLIVGYQGKSHKIIVKGDSN